MIKLVYFIDICYFLIRCGLNRRHGSFEHFVQRSLIIPAPQLLGFIAKT
jgi:hypothetical protein